MARHRGIVRWLGGACAIALVGSGCGGGDVPGEAGAAASNTAVEEEDEWEENTIPVIEWVHLEPSSPAPGGSVTAQVRVNDPDGDDIEYGYAWRINGRPVRSSGDRITLGNALKGDPISVTVTASDGWDESEAYTARAVVGNTPPVLQSVTFDPLGTIHRGQRVTARPIAIDQDGDVLQYEYRWWVNDRELSSESDMLDTSRLKRGDEVRIEVVASDGYSESNPLRSAPIKVENSPPKIVSTPANAGDASVYLYQVQAEDPDGDRRLRYRLEQGPPGMTIDPISGALSWAPAESATGTHNVEVAVDDLQGGVGSQRFTVVISEEEAAAEAAPPAAPSEG
ncbi:MAG: hypothetical protein JRH10_13840 [Deltaproteobacteria bacterium]|nr:hypothetical protein [Deltaproteobacteria bacterium]MBW2446085.1 hypothetical protein [Deltaproteobacteria bacterium]